MAQKSCMGPTRLQNQVNMETCSQAGSQPGSRGSTWYESGTREWEQHFKILEEKAGTYKKGTNTCIWITEVFIVLCLGCFSARLGVPPQNKIFILSVMQCLLSAPCMLCWTLKIIANEAGLPRVPPVVKIQINKSCLQCSMICSAKRHTECFSENTGVAPNTVSHADI